MKIRQSISATNRSTARWVLISLALGALALALLVWQTPASAAPNAKPAGLDIIVTTTADEYGTGANCSLREAIKTANDNANFGGCVASLSVFGDDTIILPAGIYTLTIAGASEDWNATGDLDITGNLNIVGAGSGVTTIDGNALDRVFHLGPYSSPTVTISGVKITNGVGSGGGIQTIGDFLTLDDVVISGNGGCTSYGGGIRNDGGVITITNSTITANCAGTTGGGIVNDSGGVVTIISSTISLNSSSTLGAGGLFSGANTTVTLTNTNILSNTAATRGGGVYANNGASLIGYGVTLQGNTASSLFGGGIYLESSSTSLTLFNSTLSGNSAGTFGGGLALSNGTINLNNTTLTNNTADSDNDNYGDGGGIYAGLGTIYIKNTIIAGNIDNGGQSPDCNATLTSQGYNLLGKNGGCTGLTNGVNGDIVGTNASPVNALLAPLANNGGLTRTHLLIPGSPASNAGNPAAPGSGGNACLAADQRGVVRPVDGRCDIGAVESVLQIMYLPVIQK